MRNNRKKEGFTLIELMLGLMILTMAVAGIFSVLTHGMRMAENARDLTRVSQILQSEMENLRSMNWSDYEALVGSKSFHPESRFTDEFEGRYELTRNLMPWRSSQYLVFLTAKWSDNLGHDHERRYLTVFTENGLNDYYYRSF